MATDRTVLVRLKAEVGQFVAGMGTAAAAVKGVTSEIDTSNDRVAWLSQSILALGPALVPLGAAVTPVMSGLATEATVAVAAVGVLALAFHGLGDAVKAVNDYQLEPTAAHLAKMQEELEKMGPAGADFVLFLDQIGPKLGHLQDLAREGIFPGAEAGIVQLMTLLPRARRLVTEIADTIGDLMSQAGGDIAGPRFERFFDFLERDARPILEDMARAVGNFASGFLNTLVGFEPLTNRFSEGLLEMSRSFRSWSEGLDDNQGFQQFLGYVESAIPKALAFSGALVEAFTSILVAAAPVGDVMLPVLTDFLNIISALAETPFGPAFLTAAAAMSLYGRAVALASVTTGGLFKSIGGANGAIATQAKLVGSLPAAFAEATASQDALVAAQARAEKLRGSYVTTLQTQNRMIAEGYSFIGDKGSASAARLSDQLGQLELANRDVENATDRARKAEQARSAAIRGTIGTAGKAAGLVGGLALVTSDYGQSIDYANTASLTLMGAMVGGAPGAAAGGLIGSFLDLKDASGKAGDAQRQLSSDLAAAGTDLEKWGDAVDAAFTRYEDHLRDLRPDTNIFGQFLNSFDPDVLNAEFDDLFGKTSVEDKLHDQATMTQADFDALNAAAAHLASSLGLATESQGLFFVSTSQMQTALTRAQPAMQALGISAQDLIDAQKESPEAAQALIDKMIAWADNANSTKGKQDALVGSVKSLNDELVLTADSASALSTALDNLLNPNLNLSAATDAWTTALRTLNKDLAKHNKTLVGNSNAAIQNREVIRDRINTMKEMLTAEAEAGAGSGKLSGDLARQRQALIDAGAAAGISKKQMRAYIDEMGLTPELVKTLIDNNAPEARGQVHALKQELNDLNGTHVKTFIDIYRESHGGSLQGQGNNPTLAGGGLVIGPGGPTDDMVPAWLSNKEFVVRAAAVDYYGLDFFNAANAKRLASGGPAGDHPTSTNNPNGGGFTVFLSPAMTDLIKGVHGIAQALRVFDKALKKSQDAVDDERTARDNITSLMSSLSSTVTSQLRSDVFSGPSNPWAENMQGSATDQLNADTARAEEETNLINSLAGKGLTGAALAEVIGGGLTRLRAYDRMSTTDLQAYAEAYARRETALSVAGTAAGAAAYGADYAAADAKLETQIQELREIKKAIRVMNQEQKEAQDKAADKVKDGVNHAGGKGKRNKVYR